MGSTKKHKKDRDGSKKHKHKSRTRSRSPISPAYERESRDVREYRDRGERDYRDQNQRDREYREKERDRRHKKHHKEKRHHRRSGGDGGYERESNRGDRYEEYHSDSSDVIEVPVAPPAPPISSTSAVNEFQNRSSRSSSPIPENGAGDCLSIEETNKLRAKLGLKPLEVDSGPINKKSSDSSKSKSGGANDKRDDTELNQYKDDFGEFYHKPADNLVEKKQAEKMRDKIKERREKRKLEEKLTRIKALGDSNSEDESASNWVKKNREKEKLKKEAETRAKMLEEMDEEFGVSALVDQEARKSKRNAYKGKDLRGLRVEHDIDQFGEGRDVILTLKDKDVLAEDEDTLVNVNMIDDERYKKNVENRKQNPNLYGYNVYADETVDEYGNVLSRPILGKYDEEIEGNRKQSFTIGASVENEIQQKRRLLEIKSKLQGKRLDSLADTKLELASEYFTTEELTKFKKPKKKVKKIRQKLKADDLLAIASNDTPSSSKDMGSRRRGRHNTDIDNDDIPAGSTDLSDVKLEEDDDDLEQILSKARRLKQKEALIIKAAPILPTLKAELKSEPENSDDDNEEMGARDSNMVLDATAEFCRTLGDIPTYGLSGNRDEEANELMDFEAEAEEMNVEPEEEESNVGVWSSVNPDAVRETANKPIELSDVAILDEEPDVSSGVAGALRLAMSKGYLEKEESNRPSGSRMAHLQAKNYSIEDKTYGDDDKFGRRDRFHSGPTVDFREKETFKPNVKLEYIDDSGRLLNAKEAFRYLSHKFHGKGPGKNKIEKRLKKMEQDQLMMKMNSTDTPLGTLNMLQQKQKETQSPYIVLSGSKQTHANSSIVKPKMK